MRPIDKRRPLFWALLLTLSYALVELSAWGGLELLGRTGRLRDEPVADIDLSSRHRERIEAWIEPGGKYFTHSPSLGWTIKANGEAQDYRSNAGGIRADREYTLEPPPGGLRISCFGESFTHCSDVLVEESWQVRLEALDTGLEVLNFGVDAYGLDQAFLRYRQDGHRFGSHIVVIGFMSENIYRSVSVFRPFHLPETGSPFTKPRFVLDAGELRLIPNPIAQVTEYRSLLDDTEASLRRLGEYDHYYRVRTEHQSQSRLPSLRLLRFVGRAMTGRDPLLPGFAHGIYDVQSEAYRVTVGVLEAFYLTVLEQGSLPIVLLYPNAFDLAQHRRGREASYRPLVDHLQRQEYVYVDLLKRLAFDGTVAVFGDGGHYSAAGNERVAQTMFDHLQSTGLSQVSGVEARLARETAKLTGSDPIGTPRCEQRLVVRQRVPAAGADTPRVPRC